MLPLTQIGITGLAAAFPQQEISSRELATRLKVTESWILERSGIESRRFISKTESAFSLAQEAVQKAIALAKRKPSQIKLIICGTTSGDYFFPCLAAKIQSEIGATNAGAFDISASATSFQTALTLAHDFLRHRNEDDCVLIAGVAVQSPFVDWKKPEMAVLLGDGAAAAIVSRVPKDYGILHSELACHGESYEAARLRPGGFIEMDGVVMGREFLKRQPELIEKVLNACALKLSDIDLFVFHQANLRLIQLLMKKLNLPLSKTHTNVERFGNTAEASVPGALAEALAQGKVKRGSRVVLSSIGAGCTLSATVLRWY